MNKKELKFQEGVYEDGPRHALSISEREPGLLEVYTRIKGESSEYVIDEEQALEIVDFIANYYGNLGQDQEVNDKSKNRDGPQDRKRLRSPDRC